MSGLLTHGWTGSGVTAEAGVGVGPSGIVVTFLLFNSDGELENSVDLSASGVVKVSIAGADYANRLGDAPTNIGGRTGHYYYILDGAEIPSPGSFVMVSVEKAGYQAVLERKDIGIATSTQVSTSTNTTAANIVNALNTIVSAVSAETTAINDHTDDAVAGLPTAAEIDTQLTGTHGEGTWAGATAAEVVAELVAYAYDADVTVDGLLKRIEAVLTGKATGLNGPLGRYYLRDGTTVAVESVIDGDAGTRGMSDVSGSED